MISVHSRDGSALSSIPVHCHDPSALKCIPMHSQVTPTVYILCFYLESILPSKALLNPGTIIP